MRTEREPFQVPVTRLADVFLSTQAHLVRLDRTPFLRPFNAAVLRTIELSSDEVNDLTLSKDGKVLGWCGDEGRLGVGESGAVVAVSCNIRGLILGSCTDGQSTSTRASRPG